MSVLNIATGNLVKFTNRLEKLSKTDLPRIVKKTLDSAAMDVKSNSMPKTAKSTFTQRKANFLKANSKVEFGRLTSDISRIKSTVGFVPLRGKNKAVDNLEKQEHGGTIKSTLIATNQARVGKSSEKMVSNKNRLGRVPESKIIRPSATGKSRSGNRIPIKSEKQQFIRAVIRAGNNGYVMSNKQTAKGGHVIFRVKNLRTNGGLSFKLEALYNKKKGRQIKVKKTGFMEKSSMESGKKLDDFFIKEATKQIDFRLTR